jgi:hypothetical protein
MSALEAPVGGKTTYLESLRTPHDDTSDDTEDCDGDTMRSGKVC